MTDEDQEPLEEWEYESLRDFKNGLLDPALRKDIEVILHSNDYWKAGYSVEVKYIDVDYGRLETESHGSYYYDYHVYDKDSKNIWSGCVHGTCECNNNKDGTPDSILDGTIELYEGTDRVNLRGIQT